MQLGAFAVIFDAQSRVLLSHRTDRDMWNLPGGRVEAGEHPWEAVLREVEEETGLRVEVERLLGVYSVPNKPELVFNFLCVQKAGQLRPTEEADKHAWFGRTELPSNTLPRHAIRIEDAYSSAHIVYLKVQD
jgi:mutator protein MutT